MKEWFSGGELEGLPGMPGDRRNIRIIAGRDGWRSRERKGRGGGREYHVTSLPTATQAALCAVATEPTEVETSSTPVDRDGLWSWAERRPGRLRAIGMERAQILLEVAQARRQGMGRDEAIEAVAARHELGAATVETWMRKVRGSDPHDWAAVLVPRYGTGRSKADCDPELWDLFLGDYMRPQAPAASACYERIKRIAEVEGRTLPSCKTLLRRIETELGWQVTVLAREGAAAVANRYPPQERDRSALRALEAVNADGHTFDVFVRWPDGEVRRPMILAWQDIYSGKLLSYRVDYKENSQAVRLSFGDVVERYGIPGHAFLDNGRAFAAKWITGGVPNRYRFKVREGEPLGLLVAMGVEVHWVTPYHGQAKPIERAFRDLCEYVAKHPAFRGAYTGNRVDAKPEDYGTRAVPLADFLKVLETEIRAHNARLGRRSGPAQGRSSFDAIFAESYQRGPVRMATAEQRRLWLLTAEKVTASKTTGAIRLFDNTYHCDELVPYAGEQLVVRFDPDRLHQPIHVYTADDAFIGTAECEQAVGFMSAEGAAELAKARRRRQRAAREMLEADVKYTAADVAARLPELPEPVIPEANVVQLAQPRHAMKPVRRVEAPAEDPDALARGERAIADLNERRRLQELYAREDDALWERYCELRGRSDVSANDADWMRSFETTSLYASRSELEQLFETKTPVGDATGA